MSMASMLARVGAAAQQGARRHRTGPDLAAQIIAQFGAASWVTPFIGLLRKSSDVSLVGSAIASLLDRSGNGKHATQATSTARPTYSATAINSRPGMTLDSGDLLVTPSIDLSPYTAAALMVLCQDTDTAARVIAEFSPNAASNVGGFYLTSNEVAGTLRFLANGGALSSAQSTAETMASPKVVTGTIDLALAANEAEIRVAGANATASRPHAGNGSALGNYSLNIGARSGPTSGMTGAIGAVVLAAGTGPISGAVLTAIANVEALLAADKGI